MRRLLRALSKLGLLGAMAAVVYALVARRRSSEPVADTASTPWPPIVLPDEPSPTIASNGAAPSVAEEQEDATVVAAVVAPVVVEEDVPAVTWLEPDDHACPPSHPVKAKLASGVFHLPGMMNYDRTKPDRCYADPATAEADGLRQAKR
ncbi:MAG TPA: hypothetical protein VK975_05025 [Acidimicrobiales bacterium]|nr:hypothetical protein [Acidimicrobiales bacterium]